LSVPFTFVHLSDLHIAPPSTLAYGTDTAANLRAVAQRIRDMQLQPACFIFSGDLSDRGESESYTHLNDILRDEFEPFGVPLLLGLGNHDTRLPFRQVILGQADADDEYEQYFYSHRVGDLRVLMLDSKLPGAVHGLLGESQLAWLDERLAEPTHGDVIVMHHPCVPRGVPRPDDYLLQDADALASVLARHPETPVLAILCGHSHVSTSALFASTLHVAAPATAYLLDPSMRAGGRGLEGAAFNLCTVREGRLVVNPVFLPSTGRELYHHTSMPAAAAAHT
jgi:3',5'-cyclic AMP phosphodiesterase CpdA